MTIEEIKQKITPILEKSGVLYAGVFGSVARGEARPDSDVDLIVAGSEKRFIKSAIERDLIPMYGQG